MSKEHYDDPFHKDTTNSNEDGSDYNNNNSFNNSYSSNNSNKNNSNSRNHLYTSQDNASSQCAKIQSVSSEDGGGSDRSLSILEEAASVRNGRKNDESMSQLSCNLDHNNDSSFHNNSSNKNDLSAGSFSVVPEEYGGLAIMSQMEQELALHKATRGNPYPKDETKLRASPTDRKKQSRKVFDDGTLQPLQPPIHSSSSSSEQQQLQLSPPQQQQLQGRKVSSSLSKQQTNRDYGTEAPSLPTPSHTGVARSPKQQQYRQQQHRDVGTDMADMPEDFYATANQSSGDRSSYFDDDDCDESDLMSWPEDVPGAHAVSSRGCIQREKGTLTTSTTQIDPDSIDAPAAVVCNTYDSNAAAANRETAPPTTNGGQTNDGARQDKEMSLPSGNRLHDEKQCIVGRKTLYISFLALVVVVLIAVMVATRKGSDNTVNDSNNPTAPTTIPTTGSSMNPVAAPSSPTLSNNNMDTPTSFPAREVDLSAFVTLLQPLSGETALNDTESDQYHTMVWLADVDEAHLIPGRSNLDLIQRYVVALFYFSTKGDQWDNTLDFLSESHVCHWNGGDGTFGVFCNNNFEVEELVLGPNKMEGTIPREIAGLRNLRVFSILENSLSGTLPSEIGELTKLETLVLEQNNIQSSIPTDVSKLRNLRELNLASNYLSGALPSELGYLTKLEILRTGSNFMVQVIPSEVGMLSKLSILSLENNKLSGSLPSEIGLMTSLGDIKIANNRLTGALPTEIGLLSALYRFDFTSNNILALHTELGKLSNLHTLLADLNRMQGTLPSELGLLTKLQWVHLSNNELTGSIPEEFANLTALELLDLSFNELSGVPPGELAMLQNLTRLNFHGNRFSGDLDPVFCFRDEVFEDFSADCDLLTCECCTLCCSRNYCA